MPHVPWLQVAGCGKDLAPLKEYHQRYRICEVHIKLPQVLKDGRLQRFCQQVGRWGSGWGFCLGVGDLGVWE